MINAIFPDRNQNNISKALSAFSKVINIYSLFGVFNLLRFLRLMKTKKRCAVAANLCGFFSKTSNGFENADFNLLIHILSLLSLTSR